MLWTLMNPASIHNGHYTKKVIFAQAINCAIANTHFATMESILYPILCTMCYLLYWK